MKAEKMDETRRKEFHAHAWQYFTIHAQQRMTSVHFYILFCSLVLGGLLASLKDAPNYKIAGLVAFVLPLLSIIFWLLDERNRQLVGGAQQALKLLEQESGLEDEQGIPHVLKVFSHEDYATDQLQRRTSLGFIPGHFTYTLCFRLIFVLFGVVGLVLGVVLPVMAPNVP
jgi:hypothetical protein